MRTPDQSSAGEKCNSDPTFGRRTFVQAGIGMTSLAALALLLSRGADEGKNQPIKNVSTLEDTPEKIGGRLIEIEAMFHNLLKEDEVLSEKLRRCRTCRRTVETQQAYILKLPESEEKRTLQQKLNILLWQIDTEIRIMTEKLNEEWVDSLKDLGVLHV